MKKAMGKMGNYQSVWAVETDHPDTVEVRVDNLHPDLLVFAHQQKISVSDSSPFQLKCSSLDQMWDLTERCFRLHGTQTSIVKTRSRLVTSATDKLCGQEKFFGENALSKQARCAHCHSTDLQSLTRVHLGKRRWGLICEKGHWGLPINPPRDFTNDTYGEEEYKTRIIPADCPWTVRGSISLVDFKYLISTLPNWKAPGDDMIT